MKRIIIITSIALTLFTMQVPAQTKRALVIGIGEQEDCSWVNINGDKDVPYVKEMLIRFGYNDITTLINKQATKAGIVSAFKKLTRRCKEGDMIYIHFSGHGQQVTDVNGDEWPDTLDEAWIPYDAYLKYDAKHYKGENHLIDDEINTLLTNIRNRIGPDGALLVVVDACHSGGSTRGEDIGETVRGVFDVFEIPGRHKGKSNKMAEQWLTLSACKDYQLNQEMKSPQLGRLTYALYCITENDNVTMESIVAFMQRNRGRYPQTPVLSGDTITHTISEFLR